MSRAEGEWRSIPPLDRVRIAARAVEPRFQSLPEELGARRVRVEGASQISVRELIGLLGAIGIAASAGDEKIAGKQFALPEYRGRLDGLLAAVERAADVAFEWRGGALVAVPAREYSAHLPQHKELIEQVAKDLSALGASSVNVSKASGLVTVRTPPSAARAIESYLDRMARNSATVTLQIAALSVSLNRESDAGIQWGQLQAILGNPAALLTQMGGQAAPSTGGASPSTGSGQGGASAVQAATGEAIGLLGQALGLRVEHRAFSLRALVSALSRYGEARTIQDVILRTVSGNPVKIRSGESVPYVSGVSVSAIGTQTGTAGLLGSASVSTAESGLTLEVEPSYDAEAQLVTMNVNLELSTILGFVELSAGAQVGKLSQPNIQKQSFNTVARLRAGDTVILGGLVFDHASDSRSGIAGLEEQPIASRGEKVQRSVLFIVIRPTVTVYEFEG